MSFTASITSRASPPTHRRTCDSTPTRSGCGWSRRRLTRTTRPSTTSSTPTSSASAGADITFFEYPGGSRPRGRRDGAPFVFRVGTEASLDFWASASAASATRLARLHRSRRARARTRRRRRRGRTAGRAPPRDSGGARPSRLRGRSCIRIGPGRSARFLEGSTFTGGRRLGGARRPRAASTSTTRRPPNPACPAPARCITSPGRRRSTSMPPGCRRLPRRAPTRPR